MKKIYVFSDPHFGDTDMLTVAKRPFNTIWDHDEAVISGVNAVVTPADILYCLGDVAMKKAFLARVKELNGHKRLVRGNHDIFRTKDYLDAGFEEIYGVRVFPELNLILSHIPLHPDSVTPRGWTNYHGHIHSERYSGPYVNVCLEHLPLYHPLRIR